MAEEMSQIEEYSEPPNQEAKILVDVQNLKKYFPVRSGLLQRVVGWVKAVDDVSFHIYEGESFGLVGESGCGKTTVGRTLLHLIPPTGGKVYFDGQEIVELSDSDLMDLRQNMQIIFQDPFSSLDPRMPVGESIAEGLKIHTDLSGQERYDVVVEMLTRVGMRAEHARRYPHEFSGGQRQRIGIARALALRPKLIICDEPVSALDVSIQAAVLNILKDLQRDFGLTYLRIAQNLSVVQQFSNRDGVMYLGRLVEVATRADLFSDPLHPYTQALMSAIPVPDPTARRQRIILEGDVPSPLNPPLGCRFHTRCPLAFDKCSQEEPQLIDYGIEHYAACWLLETGVTGASKISNEYRTDQNREFTG
jgi:peptide/nickel transport system ATP-binding protein/oligopeptide transport system ATP-binding protein